MKAPKLRKKLLAGILCAGMVFQTIPINAFASESISVAETQVQTESEEMPEETVLSETAAPETEEPAVSPESEAQTDTTVEETEQQTQTESETQTVTEPETLSTEVPETVLTETEIATEEGSQEAGSGEAASETEMTESETQENQTAVPIADDDLIDYTTLRMATEETYYYYGNKLYIIAKLSGCEIPDDVIMEFAIDEKVCGANAPEPFGEIYKDESHEGYYIIIFEKGDLASTNANSHNISITLSKTTAGGGIRELVTREGIFTVEEQDIFLEKTPYYMGVSDDSVEVVVFNTADDIETMALANNGETVAAPTDDSKPAKTTTNTDPRYT